MWDETIFRMQLSLYPKLYLGISTAKTSSSLNASPESEKFPYFPQMKTD
jgi:hypothetical protein